MKNLAAQVIGKCCVDASHPCCARHDGDNVADAELFEDVVPHLVSSRISGVSCAAKKSHVRCGAHFRFTCCFFLLGNAIPE